MVRLREGEERLTRLPSSNKGRSGTREASPRYWKPGTGGYKDINVLLITLKAGQMKRHPTMSLALREARWIRNELYEWVKSYSEREASSGLGFEQFKQDWRTFRVWCPLQVRLAVEEILWVMGPEYRALVTGFRPID